MFLPGSVTGKVFARLLDGKPHKREDLFKGLAGPTATGRVNQDRLLNHIERRLNKGKRYRLWRCDDGRYQLGVRPW